MQVRDQITWSLPSLIPGLLARPSTPFSAGSRERPPSPNFPQLYIVEPSSGFNKGLRSALERLLHHKLQHPLWRRWINQSSFACILVDVNVGKPLPWFSFAWEMSWDKLMMELSCFFCPCVLCFKLLNL
jgi:hypothetical protein